MTVTSLLHKTLRIEQHSRQKYLFRTLFILVWTVNEWIRTNPTGDSGRDVQPTAYSPVLTEFVKFVISATFYLWQRRSSSSPSGSGKSRSGSEYRGDAVPLNGLNESANGRDNEVSVANSGYRYRVSRSLAVTLTVLAAVFFTYHEHLETPVGRLTGPSVLYLASSAATVFLLFAAYVTSYTVVTPLSWQAALSQFSGFWIITSGLMARPLAIASLYSLCIGLVFSKVSMFALMEFLYRKVHTMTLGMLFMSLFTTTCIIDLFSPVGALLSTETAPLSWGIFLHSVSKAMLDFMIFYGIYLEGAISIGVLLSASTAVYLLIFCLLGHTYTAGLLLGSCIVLSGTFAFFNQEIHEDHSRKGLGWLPRLLAAIATSVIIIYLALNTHQAVLESAISVPVGGISLLNQIVAAQVTCHRKPLASVSYWPGKRTYHAFDNVLLIVFFSHARYDANLDYYQEVYSEFFPNIVYIGPGNREDQGFRHSYDVMVDTYEADEDLSDPSFYKMAGRMAHHMLYTAMREHDCYDGYLWAPFDTLLNVPRLQQFDQNFFWYHSPFGQYVFNPALGDEAANQNKSRHAPPAKISPDPALNLTASWRHWGPDWWWGEPHVGVDVCMPAFNKVAPEMREHLAELTNGTRFIGGSADTLYIPGRHRDAFLEVLGLFLETDCFLEIATPTAAHLVSPPGEPILYVDHWWIWQLPFNATFVRQQWAKGFEVDTFHTFHWGDRGEDGTWRGEPRHIEDVRGLQRESALRQGLEWPY